MGAEQSGTKRKLFENQLLAPKSRTEHLGRNYRTVESLLIDYGILSPSQHNGHVRSHSVHEIGTLNTSDSDNEVLTRNKDLERENLVMLRSTLDPLGRKIRRVSTDVVDGEEQLLLVKRRASAARRIALNNNDSDHSRPRDFEYLKVIGAGGMGRVVLVRNRQNDRLYAMKVVSKRSVRDKNQIKHVISERDVLGGTHHHALVHLHWAFQTKRSLYLVMDYCAGGELSIHLQEAEQFSEEVATFYAAQLVLALEHLHRHGVIYRDLKPENILLTAEGHLKLVDFGLSKFGITEATKGATSICGSYEYVAPEVFENNGYGTAIDWWSFGVVLYEMLTGLPPWYHENPHVMRRHIRTKTLTFPAYVSTTARNLIRQLLVLDPTKRLGSSEGSLELRHHPFFKSVDWQMHTFREIDPPIRPCASRDYMDNTMSIDELSRLSIDSMDSTSSCSEEFGGFDFEAPSHTHIQYGYKRDLGAIVA